MKQSIINKVVVFFIALYRVAISPFVSPCCRFFPTCSSYTMAAIEKYGVILFRGFNIKPNELMTFTDIYTESYSGDAMRREIRFNNKNVRNVDYGFSKVDLHSEASFTPSWPELIWFYCIIPPINGGETTLCDGIKLWNSLSNKTKGFFLSEQIHYELKIPVMNKKNENIKKILLEYNIDVSDVLYIGDAMGDFPKNDKANKYILPNPMYGKW